MMKLAIASGAALAVALMLPLHAQTMRQQSQQNPAGEAPLTQAERFTTEQFLDKAWNINQFEIQAGREAENKATSGFRDYARMIVEDHAKMNDELKSAIQKSGLKLPTTLDREHQAELDQLKAATERNFDKQFRTQQIKGHQQALRIFQAYASNGDNADLRSFAQNAVASLQRHLDQAEKPSESSGVM
jgi:putative membrane protein